MPTPLDPKVTLCLPRLYAMFVEKRALTRATKKKDIAVANLREGAGILLITSDMFYYMAHFDGDVALAGARLEQHLDVLDSYSARQPIDGAWIVAQNTQSPLCKRLTKALRDKQKKITIKELKGSALSYSYRTKKATVVDGSPVAKTAGKALFEDCRNGARSVWALSGDGVKKEAKVYVEGQTPALVADRFDDQYLAKFYAAIGKPLSDFQKMLTTELFPEFAKVSGGGKTPAKKLEPALKEAVTALNVYIKAGHPSGNAKLAFFANTFMRTFSAGKLPNAAKDVDEQLKQLDLVESKFNLVLSKFMVIDHWEQVVKGNSKDLWFKDHARYWLFDEVFNFDPPAVRMVMESLLEDCQEALESKHLTKELETWRGSKATGTLKFTHDDLVRTLNANAMAAIGGEIKGSFQLKYEGFSLSGDLSGFAGAKLKASADGTKKKGKGKAATGKAEASAVIGVVVSGNIALDIDGRLKASAGAEAMAGAMAKANLEFQVDGTRIKLKAGAKAFAGVKVEGNAKSTFFLDGRPVLTGKAKASANLGLGATAKGGLECDIFGKTKLSGKLGATAGAGTDLGLSFEVDTHNLYWGMANLFYAAAHDCHMKRKRKWLLPLEENVELGKKTKAKLKEYLEKLTSEHKEEWLRLEQWRVLETKIRAQVTQKNQFVAGLKPPGVIWI